MAESDDEFPFDAVDPNAPVCKNIDPTFCQAIFRLKQMIYTDIVYSKDPNTTEAQDIKLLDTYESIIRQMHGFFKNLLKGSAITLPKIQGITTATQQAIEALYARCIEEKQNSDRYSLDLYKILMDNMFHTYIYDMGTQ